MLNLKNSNLLPQKHITIPLSNIKDVYELSFEEYYKGNNLILGIITLINEYLEQEKNNNDPNNTPLSVIFEYLQFLDMLENYQHYGNGIYINKLSEFPYKNYSKLRSSLIFYRNFVGAGMYKTKLLYFPLENDGSIYKGKLQVITIPYGYYNLLSNILSELNALGRVITVDILNKKFYTDVGTNWYETNETIKEKIDFIRNTLQVNNGLQIYESVLNKELLLVWNENQPNIFTYVYIPETIHLHFWAPEIEIPLNPLALIFKDLGYRHIYLYSNMVDNYTFDTYQKELIEKIVDDENVKDLLINKNFILAQINETAMDKHSPFDEFSSYYPYIPFFIPKYLFVKYDSYTYSQFFSMFISNPDVYNLNNNSYSYKFVRYNFENGDWEEITYDTNTKSNYQNFYDFLMKEGMNWEDIINVPIQKYKELSLNPNTNIVLMISNYIPVFLMKPLKIFLGNHIYVYEDDKLRNRFNKYYDFFKNIFVVQI